MKRNSFNHSTLFSCLLSLLLGALLVACNGNVAEKKLLDPQDVTPMPQFTTSKKYPAKFADEDIKNWKKQIPDIQEIRVKSSLDGQEEPALLYDSGSKQKKPLLVILHSWSSEYLQEVSIPYGLWAMQHDWIFLQPNFRGKFDHPEAAASDLAIQDIVDAVAYATANAHVDSSRIYVVGSSGGAMTALITAAKHPDLWAGVVAWVPVMDVAKWYQYNTHFPARIYNTQMQCFTGGSPDENSAPLVEYIKRSPITYIENLRDVPIFLAHGVQDQLVPPDHTLNAFNILAKPEDRIPEEHIEFILKERALPEEMQNGPQNPYFIKTDPPALFTRESNNVHLVLFKGVHDMAYNPTLLWLNEQQRHDIALPSLSQN